MTDIDYDQPIKVSDHLAGFLARMLARSYPGTTAADVIADLARPASVPARPDGTSLDGHEPPRGILGRFAAASLEGAVDAGSVVLGPDDVFTAK